MKIAVQFSGWRLFIWVILPTAACFSAPAQPLRLASGVDPNLGPSSGASGPSGHAVLSPDGRFVLFASAGENLVEVPQANPTNSSLGPRIAAPLNVYLRDRSNGTTTLVTPGIMGGALGNDSSVPFGISTNGRYALFESSASNLVPGDTNDAAEVFVRDLLTSTTILVSASTNGTTGNGASRSSVMTPDGRFVAFASTATDLVPDDTNNLEDIFLRDLETRTTTLVSVGATVATPIAPNTRSDLPVISADGRFVAFSSNATNIVPGTPPVLLPIHLAGMGHIYVRDVLTGITLWASRDAQADPRQGLRVFSFNHAISEDGQFVVYEASQEPRSPAFVLRFHVPSGLTEIVHTNAYRAWGANGALNITPDGNKVAFVAHAVHYSGTTSAIRVWDAQSGTTRLVSGDLMDGVVVLSESTAPSVDRSGRYVAFLSDSPGPVTNQLAPGYHVYVRDLQTGTTVLVDADAEGFGVGVDLMCAPSLSADGRFAAFSAPDSTLTPRDHNLSYDLFVRDLAAGTNELISAAHDSLLSDTPNAPGVLHPGTISTHGRSFAFTSMASDLIAGDLNGHYDIYVRNVEYSTNELISAGGTGALGNGASVHPAMTPDGRFVAFASANTNLLPGLTNSALNVFVRDRQSRSTILVSSTTNGMVGGDRDSFSPTISADGRFVLFYSAATNLVPGPALDLGARLYLRDLQTALTYALTPYAAFSSSMTRDGRMIAYTAASSGLTNQADQLYVWDSLLAARVFTNIALPDLSGPLALSPDGTLILYGRRAEAGKHELYALNWAANTSWLIAEQVLARHPGLRFSEHGRFLVYASATGSALAPLKNQVFLHDFHTGENEVLSRSYLSGDHADGHSDSPDISADGRFVAYRSQAADLVPGDTNEVADIFLYDRASGTTTLLSTSPSGSSANSFSANPIFSPDGTVLLFESHASDLSPELRDFNSYADIFAYRIYSAGDIPLFRATLSSSPEALSITWPVQPGKTYRVQYKDNLAEPAWKDLPADPTISGSQGSLHQPASNEQRFFRVVAF